MYIERGLLKALTHLTTACSLVLAPMVLDGKAAASGTSVVGNLASEPFLRVKPPGNLWQDKDWNSLVVESGSEVSPGIALEVIGNQDSPSEKIPDELTLRTFIQKIGAVRVCIYPRGAQSCVNMDQEVNESSFVIAMTNLKQQGNPIKASSVQFEAAGSGRVKIEMEVKDDKTDGLLTSTGGFVSVVGTQGYFPSLQKGNLLNHQVHVPSIQQRKAFIELKGKPGPSRFPLIINNTPGFRERKWQKRAA